MMDNGEWWSGDRRSPRGSDVVIRFCHERGSHGRLNGLQWLAARVEVSSIGVQHLRKEVAAVLVDIEGYCESFAISSHVSLRILS